MRDSGPGLPAASNDCQVRVFADRSFRGVSKGQAKVKGQGKGAGKVKGKKGQGAASGGGNGGAKDSLANACPVNHFSMKCIVIPVILLGSTKFASFHTVLAPSSCVGHSMASPTHRFSYRPRGTSLSSSAGPLDVKTSKPKSPSAAGVPGD